MGFFDTPEYARLVYPVRVCRSLDDTLPYPHYSNPEWYDGACIYGNEDAPAEQGEYSDRMWTWNHDRMKAAWAAVPDGQRRTPRGVEAMLAAWSGHPVRLVSIYAQSNRGNGYDVYFYRWSRVGGKYTLTTQDMKTYGGLQLAVGVPVETDGGGSLYGPGWLDYYHDPLLAAQLNHLHIDIACPRLWEVDAEGDHLDDYGIKGGCTRMTLLRELPMPELTTTQRAAFGILCAREVCTHATWLAWADAWLSGDDRSEASVATAWTAVWEAQAGHAPHNASSAAWAIAASGEAAETWVMGAAAIAAEAAARIKPIDLIAIARRAMEY